MYAYVYVCMHVYTHTHIHIYVHTCIHTCVYTHTHTHTQCISRNNTAAPPQQARATSNDASKATSIASKATPSHSTPNPHVKPPISLQQVFYFIFLFYFRPPPPLFFWRSGVRLVGAVPFSHLASFDSLFLFFFALHPLFSFPPPPPFCALQLVFSGVVFSYPRVCVCVCVCVF
jgi:hypothetical protein